MWNRRVFLGEALHFLQHSVKDWHHPSLIFTLRLNWPEGAVLLKTREQKQRDNQFQSNIYQEKSVQVMCVIVRHSQQETQVHGAVENQIKLNKHAYIFITVSCHLVGRLQKVTSIHSTRAAAAHSMQIHSVDIFPNVFLPHNLPFRKCQASENKLIEITLLHLSYKTRAALTWLPAGPVSEPLLHGRQANSSVVVLTDS